MIKYMKKKRYWLYPLIGISIFLIGILSRIFGDVAKNEIYIEKGQQKYFAILPHFTLQPQTVEKFYRFLQTTYTIDNKKPLNIVLISPDHFNASDHNIDMLCLDTDNFCYQWNCISARELPYTKTSGCLGKGDIKEHGLGEHFSFIKKIFPEANIYPIVVKPRKFIEDAELIKMLDTYAFKGPTLFLASVDFSHYTDEDFALLHDKKSFYTLNNATGMSAYSTLEADCPSCLYIVNTLAHGNAQFPRLFLRDSSSSIAKKNLGTGNTSRQFIYYTGQKEQENGFTVAFFGDLMFDRQVAIKLSWDLNIKQYFKTFFQKQDINLPLSVYPHRKLFGIDIVGLNLETPAVSDKKICQKSNKEVKFCSSDSILPYLKNIGFTLMNLANNHSLDGWTQAHLETVQQIKNNRLNYIGYIRNGKYFEKDYVWKTTIRGIKVAWQWFDFTITPRTLFNQYCDQLKKNKTDGYINMVSVHRGTEYQKIHDILQESIGKQLIDCWADVIIGHHPHVVQDIWRYKDKPIIYSLGNFLFDMKDPPETKTGAYVLIDYQKNWTISLSTWTINASIYQQ